MSSTRDKCLWVTYCMKIIRNEHVWSRIAGHNERDSTDEVFVELPAILVVQSSDARLLLVPGREASLRVTILCT